MIFAKE
jgi:hypothetical protein